MVTCPEMVAVDREWWLDYRYILEMGSLGFNDGLDVWGNI